MDIGDKIYLMCPPRSYSNLIGVVSNFVTSCSLRETILDLQDSFRNMEECNSNGSYELRGVCYGADRSTQMVLNIEQASANLMTDQGFVEGAYTYLTSEFEPLR